jgi:hypothetical protein
VFRAWPMTPIRAQSCHGRRMRRDDICLYLCPAERAELEAPRLNRNTPRKLAWRGSIVLATVDDADIRRRSQAGVNELEAATYDYLLMHNAKPKPFIGNKAAADILS